MALQTQDLLQERYRIVRIIKSGGMGSVYEAEDTKLADSPCAVKEMHEAARSGKDSEYILGRFNEEMRALVGLDHPAIPKVRDYLTVDSTIYIVMDLVQGRSLDEEIEETMRLTGQPAPADQVVQDMLLLLDTLVYLHGHEPPIVHRDIKPANILRDKRGRIKLVDFGLARKVDGGNTQTVVGTLGYCSPEQMMGKAEQRSDIYAVGVTMCHMLTGSPPEMMLFEPRRPELPHVRPGLVSIIEKATQPHPAERYSTAQEMITDLQAWLNAGPLGGAVDGPTVPLARPQGELEQAPMTRLMPKPLPPTLRKVAGAACVLALLGTFFALGRQTGLSPGEGGSPVASTPTAVASAAPTSSPAAATTPSPTSTPAAVRTPVASKTPAVAKAGAPVKAGSPVKAAAVKTAPAKAPPPRVAAAPPPPARPRYRQSAPPPQPQAYNYHRQRKAYSPPPQPRPRQAQPRPDLLRVRTPLGGFSVPRPF